MAFTQTIQILPSFIWVIEGRPSKISSVVMRVMLSAQVTATADFIVAVTKIMSNRVNGRVLLALPLMSVSPENGERSLDQAWSTEFCFSSHSSQQIPICEVGHQYSGEEEHY